MMIRRPPRFRQSRSSAASDVYKGQTKALFDADFATIQNQEEATKKFTETLHLTVKLAFFSAYFDSSFDWRKYGNDIHEAIVIKAQDGEPPAADFGAMGF